MTLTAKTPSTVGGSWQHEGMKSRVVSPTMIGRQGELGELVGVFQESLEGNPKSVVLSGEAGIGKSRLLA